MTVSVSLVRLLDEVRTNCSGVTDGILRRTTFTVLREFFRRSNVWLFELPVFIQPGINDYILSTCQHANVLRLMALCQPAWKLIEPIQYVPCDPPQFIMYNGNQPNYETQNPYPRLPMEGGLLNAGTKCPVLRIVWNPGYNTTWIATLSMGVADPVDGRGLPVCMPDWIIEKYFDYIAHGITAQLMLQPNKSYSNPKLAEYHMRKFHEGVGLARTENRHLFTYGGQRWMFPQNWNTPLHHKAV